DNGRSPSVGTFRRKAEIIEGNLFGYGDEVYFAYTNTDGSDVLDAAYTIPVNAYNGTVRFFYSNRDSDVIEPPFDRIDIESESELYEITYRQPIIRTPEQEFTLGITGSHRQGQTYILDDIPFSLSLGADEGETRISSLRFFQEWVQRSQTDVFALRSQFSFGVDLLGTTQNDDLPDGDYFAWRGQAQWVKLLDTETLLLARTDIQLAGTDLLAQEQFGLGGIESVRGYRQDALLTDSGVLASVELRLPLYHEPQDEIVLQIVPFVDFGMGWNLSKREDPDPDHLFSVGLGLQFEYSDHLSMRFDWGIPLVDIDSRDRTWQEQGLYFSVIYNLF
ncbi:MAG: ShlB/FhaC/HecB family hemolysin secretion/activation protein, partial [Cyanobacteria bacterium J083]